MVLLDSNIIIYSAQSNQDSLRYWLKNQQLATSIVSKIEVLGYHRISDYEIQMAKYYFSLCHIFKLENDYVNKAIELKQDKKMSLGDAIIAATALKRRLPLVTANTKDFKHIENLEIIDPFKL
ncbi:MAG TPA: type II toxin-antitoxin system VapC family toxin [Flavobacteriaceae bacterium]|nr:type II toxin-antitoxin system VapC family toxin [Flavobacteriaceae bacterium]